MESPNYDIYKRSRNRMRSKVIPPHFVLNKKKQVVFHIPGAFPVNMVIPNWMKSFPSDYKYVVIRCEETFYRLRTRAKK